jgi:hypothetical protein
MIIISALGYNACIEFIVFFHVIIAIFFTLEITVSPGIEKETKMDFRIKT